MTCRSQPGVHVCVCVCVGARARARSPWEGEPWAAVKGGCKLSRIFDQDKEQRQQPNKEVAAAGFQRSKSEISGRLAEWK